MTDTSSRELFDSIRQWTNEAKSRTADCPPDPGLLCKVMPGGSIRPGTPTKRNGRTLVPFKTAGIETSEPRYVLLIHYAIIRALELVPGVKIVMVDETGRQDRKTGRIRPDDERIYRINLQIAARIQKGLKKSNQGIGRVLFNVAPDAELHERRNHDHHFLIPESHILTKRRALTPPPSQDDVIDAIGKLINATPSGSCPFTADEMIALLTDLFTLSDEWHWDELEDRLPTDSRRGDSMRSRT